MFLRKILFFIILIIQSSYNSIASGIFLGAHAGASYDNYKDKFTIETTQPITLQKKGVSILGGLNFGYILPPTNKHLLIGGGVYLSMHPSKKKSSMPSGSSKVNFEGSCKYSAKALVMAGMFFNPKAAVYALAGVGYYLFEIKHSVEETNNATPPAITTTSFNNKKKTIAPIIGAGALYRITDSISVGGELHIPVLKKIKIDLNQTTSCEVSKTSLEGMLTVRFSF